MMSSLDDKGQLVCVNEWNGTSVFSDTPKCVNRRDDVGRSDTVQISATSPGNDRYLSSWVGRLGSYGV